jgi:hypothetical protein
MTMPTMGDARLRAAFRAVADTRPVSERVSCPAPELLLELVERRGAEEARLETLDHVMSCGACRREVDLLRTAVSAAEETMPQQRRATTFPTRWMAIAATVVVAAGIGLVWQLRDREAPFVMRGGGQLALHEATRTTTGDALVAWRPATGARSYDVTVLDETGVELANRRVSDTTLVLADSLVGGRRGLVVSVTAALGDGSTEGPVSGRITVPAR